MMHVAVKAQILPYIIELKLRNIRENERRQSSLLYSFPFLSIWRHASVLIFHVYEYVGSNDIFCALISVAAM